MTGIREHDFFVLSAYSLPLFESERNSVLRHEVEYPPISNHTVEVGCVYLNRSAFRLVGVDGVTRGVTAKDIRQRVEHLPRTKHLLVSTENVDHSLLWRQLYKTLVRLLSRETETFVWRWFGELKLPLPPTDDESGLHEDADLVWAAVGQFIVYWLSQRDIGRAPPRLVVTFRLARFTNQLEQIAEGAKSMEEAVLHRMFKRLLDYKTQTFGFEMHVDDTTLAHMQDARRDGALRIQVVTVVGGDVCDGKSPLPTFDRTPSARIPGRGMGQCQ